MERGEARRKEREKQTKERGEGEEIDGRKIQGEGDWRGREEGKWKIVKSGTIVNGGRITGDDQNMGAGKGRRGEGRVSTQ